MKIDTFLKSIISTFYYICKNKTHNDKRRKKHLQAEQQQALHRPHRRFRHSHLCCVCYRTVFNHASNIKSAMIPTNQHELVLHTLIYPPQELTIGYWMQEYKTHKWSSRLGDVERLLNTTLVERQNKKFVNRFGHTSTYKVYIPIHSKDTYIAFFNKLHSKLPTHAKKRWVGL